VRVVKLLLQIAPNAIHVAALCDIMGVDVELTMYTEFSLLSL
jgi:hypothetical protein